MSTMPLIWEPAFRRWLPMLGAAIICILAPMLFSSSCHEPWIIPKIFLLATAVLLLWGTRFVTCAVGMSASRTSSRLTKAIAIMLAAFLVTTAGSIDIPTSVFGVYLGQFHGLIQAVLYASLYYAVARSEGVSSDNIIALTLFGSLWINGWAVCQKIEWLPQLAPYFGWGMQGGRAGSTFGSPIFLGSFIALIMPLAYAWQTQNGWRRVLGSVAIVLALAASWAARARGGAVGGFIGMLIYEASRGGNVGSAVESLVLGLILVGIFRPVHVGSDIGRFEIWRAALMGWIHHPLLGNGPDTFALVYNRYVRDNIITLYGSSDWVQLSAHNDFLQILSTMGLIGLSAYLYFVFRVFGISSFRWLKDGNFGSLAISCALAAVFVQAKVQAVHICVIAICAALVATQDRWPTKLDDMAEWRKQFVLSLAGLVVAFGLFRITQRQVRATVFEKIAIMSWAEKPSMEALSMFNRAAVENPYQLHYIQREMDALWTAFQTFDADNAKRAAAISMMTSEHALSIHPNDPAAHDLRALSLRVLQLANGSDTIKEAQYEMWKAHLLAPTAKMYISDSMEIAKQANDMDSFVKHKKDLEHITGLEQRL